MQIEYTQVVVNKAEILKHVISEHLNKDVSIIGREKLLVEARFIYFYILRETESMSYQKIADTVKMNHASVLHGYKQAKSWIDTDYKFKDKYLVVLYSYTKSVYGIEKQKEVIELREEFEKQQEDKIKIATGKIRPMRRIGDQYDKLHMLIDKTPEEKVEDLLTRVQAIYNMMQVDLKRKRV